MLTTPRTPEAAAPCPEVAAPAGISFAEALRFWLKLGFISFGGPAGQIAIMHQKLVEKRRWISERRFLHALNYCMVLPGPEAQQLATYIGWLMHRTLGGARGRALRLVALRTSAGRGPRALGWSAGRDRDAGRLEGNTDAEAWFFAYHVLWPDGFGGRFEWPLLAIGLAAGVALFRYRVGVIPTILGCGAAGLACRALVTI
jgi:hypothetical protein